MEKKYQVMPDMSPEQFEALKQDIAERGVLTPIDIDEKGNILDGHHRVRACKELGITNYPTIVRLGLSEEEKRIFARKSNMMRRHLSKKQIREIIKQQLKDSPQWADNRIAKELGVDSKTVNSLRRQLEATSEIPKLERFIGADGKERPRRYQKAVMVESEKRLTQILKLLEEQNIDIEKLSDMFSSSEEFIYIYDRWWESERGKKFKKDYAIYFKVSKEMNMGIISDGWLARNWGSVEEFVSEEGTEELFDLYKKWGQEISEKNKETIRKLHRETYKRIKESES